MDLEKIGKFIAEKRKGLGLTQAELAEKLSISEKTVSKWECGRGFIDASLILALCDILEISANELLSGENIEDKKYKENAEQNIVNLAGDIRKKNKFLFIAEIFLIVFSLVICLGCAFVAEYVKMALGYQLLLIFGGLAFLFVGAYLGLYFEYIAGYYECKNCGHKHIPSFGAVFWALHMGTTRHLKCPNCGKRTWHKKRWD